MLNRFIIVYSAVMDITLAFLPWKLVWALQMRKKEKFGVAVAMSCGVLYFALLPPYCGTS